MNKETFNISKLSVDNKEKTLYAEWTESEVGKSGKILINQVTKQGNQPVTDEMMKLLRLFVPHFLMICEVPEFTDYTFDYLKKKSALNDAEIKRFFVSGFSISAKGLITLTGGVRREDGRVTSMNAPVTSTDLEQSPYDHVKALNVLIESAFECAYQYFKEGVFGQAVQTDAFDQPEEKEGAEVN